MIHCFGLRKKNKTSSAVESYCASSVLNKTNFFGIATEALPATHQTILADDCVRVSANTTRALIQQLKINKQPLKIHQTMIQEALVTN